MVTESNQRVAPDGGVLGTIEASDTVVEGGSHDADTPKIQYEGGAKAPLRIAGVGGTEIGTGNDAEYFRNGLFAIFGGKQAKVTSEGKGKFGRDVGNMEVEGINWRHLMYEVGVSTNWTNYGYDKPDSEEDERYKWYAGKSQATNVDAYKLLEEQPNPSDIISDEEFNRIESLRKSLNTHMADAQEGVLDKDNAFAVAKELMSNPELLTLAQKRRWYEKARTSNVGKVMMANWNDPYVRADIEEQARVPGVDVSPRVDTSYWGMTKNAFKQQFGEVGKFKYGTHGGSYRDGTQQSSYTLEDLDNYIAKEDISPDVAAEMYDEFEVRGGKSAIETGENAKIDREKVDIENKLQKQKGFGSVAKTLYMGAAPYLVDPATYIGGYGLGKVAAKVTFTKVASPLMRSMLEKSTIGFATGLGESVAYTANNYKDFSNEELLQTWALDSGMGGAFGSIFALGRYGIDSYGSRLKRNTLSEIDDIQYRSPDADSSLAKTLDEDAARMNDMQDEVAEQLNKGAEQPEIDVSVKPPEAPPKPEPKPDATAKVDGEPTGKGKPAPTEAEIEAEELARQTADIEARLQHQNDVVRPALDAARVDSKKGIIGKLAKVTGLIAERELATRFIKNVDAKMSFVGTNILETGIGFSGKFRRKASAALIKDAYYTRNIGNLNRAYVDNIKAWAMQQGGSKYQAFKAAWEGGRVNDVAKQFHREVFKYQETLQMGRTPQANEYIENYIKALNKTNDELFEGRIANNVKGFSKERRVANYIPHVWKKVKVAAIVDKFGEQSVKDLLRESAESAQRAGKMFEGNIDELVDRQYNWITGLGDSVEYDELLGAGISARSKSRMPLDFTVEKNGISMLDLVDTDIPSLMDSYVQRAGADIGISEATGGAIRSEGDFKQFLMPENADDAVLMNDVMDMMYGRPTRGGMAPEVRNLMDLVTIKQMGGIGAAQLAETGTMAQRMIVNYMSHPEIGKKIWRLAGEDINDKGVMHQIRSIAAVNDNMEYINRYSVNNIDQSQIDELSNLRAVSLDSVDKLTLGAYKAQFGRLLGSLSGVHAVQKAQSRLLQVSFSVDVARHFQYGTGTSTIGRLNDLGLGKKVGNAIRDHVEFDADGFPTNFNFEKWDKKALNEFTHAMNREEAQLMPRIMAGELPEYMNKPLWQTILQFRKTPIAFMSKGAQRNLQFADREAALGTVLNTMTAGTMRYAKIGLGYGVYTALTDAEWDTGDAWDRASGGAQTYNYVSNNGLLGDAYTIAKGVNKAFEQKDGLEALWEGAQQVSIISDIDAGYGALQGDPTDIKRSMPLNTLPIINEVSNAVVKSLEEQ